MAVGDGVVVGVAFAVSSLSLAWTVASMSGVGVGGTSLLLPIVEQAAAVIAVIMMMRMRMGSRIGTVGDSLAFASYLGACRSLWCLGRAGSTLGAGHPLRAMCDGAGTALVGARHSHGGLVGHYPVDEGAEVADQALVDSALRDMLGPVPGTPSRRAVLCRGEGPALCGGRTCRCGRACRGNGAAGRWGR